VVAPWGVALAGFAVYVIRGVWLAGGGVRTVLALLWAPVYMIWKVVLALRSPRSSPSRESEWIRTAREGEKP